MREQAYTCYSIRYIVGAQQTVGNLQGVWQLESLWLMGCIGQLFPIMDMQTQGEWHPNWDMQMDRGMCLLGGNKKKFRER